MKTVNKKKESHFMGRILVDEDFIVFRPEGGYRVNSNTVLVKNTPNSGFIFECTPNAALSVSKIEDYMKKQEIDESYIRYIILSHAHQDHYANLKEYQKRFPEAKTISHERDINSIRFPFMLPKTWSEGLRHKGFSERSLNVYRSVYSLFTHFYFKSFQNTNKIDYFFKEDRELSVGNSTIQLLHTPGHSPGHICILDSNKNLFVADLVPFTPWCCPVESGIDDMMGSIKKILRLSPSKVKRIVKSHGDIRRTPHQKWEIAQFSSEMPKYESFLKSIRATLKRIPSEIKGKEVDLEYICSLFNPNFAKYSKLMKAVFIPPAISWAIAYALKLETEGKIQRVSKKYKNYWTA